jgi:hypothetical protein
MLGVTNQLALPSQIGGDGQPHEPKPALNALPLSSRPGVFAPSTVDEIVFLGEGDDHLSGAGGVLVDRNDHAPVEPPWA